MARWTASAKWAAGPALDGQRDMPLALRLSEGLGVNAHKFAARKRIGHLLALSLQVFDMQLNGLVNECCNFLACLSSCDTAGEIGDVGAKAARALFDDDQILHK